MIRSMTGYGKGEVTAEDGRTVVEVRSVNHRYGEVSVRLPRALACFEGEIRKCVGERLRRGRIEVSIQQENTAADALRPVLDIHRARAYYEALTALKETLGLDGPVTLALVAAQKDVLVSGEGEAVPETFPGSLHAALLKAVEGLDGMRIREGAQLKADIQGRRTTLATIVERIAERVPAVVAESGVRLRERLAQLLGGVAVDEQRLAQEIAVMADRSDISEELVRLKSHLQQFDETLESEEPVGRKLDFLLQEMNREVNTIGSKANDARIALLVVELKAELEKIREQVQNIE